MGLRGAAGYRVEEPAELRVVQIALCLTPFVCRFGFVVEVRAVASEQSMVDGEPERPGHVGCGEIEPDAGEQPGRYDGDVGERPPGRAVA